MSHLMPTFLGKYCGLNLSIEVLDCTLIDVTFKSALSANQLYFRAPSSGLWTYYANGRQMSLPDSPLWGGPPFTGLKVVAADCSSHTSRSALLFHQRRIYCCHFWENHKTGEIANKVTLNVIRWQNFIWKLLIFSSTPGLNVEAALEFDAKNFYNNFLSSNRSVTRDVDMVRELLNVPFEFVKKWWKVR